MDKIRSEGLEDQLRRMILSNNPDQPAEHNAIQFDQASARLPPQNQQPGQPGQRGRNAGGPQHRNHGPFHGQPGHPRHDSYRMNPSEGRGARQGASHQGNQPHYSQSHQPRGQQHFRQQQGRFHDRAQPFGSPASTQRARAQQQMQLDPNAFQRGGFAHPQGRQHGGPQQLFNPNGQHGMSPRPQFDYRARPAQYLEQFAALEIRNVEMTVAERDEKESFRRSLEQVCHEVCQTAPDRMPAISLECFGSFQSGFATAGSDMDLVIVVKDQSLTSACFTLNEDDLPRALEKRLLQLGYGARLLTRTRVPIIKVCEKPGADLLGKLKEEREKWDALPDQKKYPHECPHENGAPEEAELVEEDELVQSVPAPSVTESNGPAAEAQAEGGSQLDGQNATGSVGSNGTGEVQPDTAGVHASQKDSQSGDKPKSKRDEKQWTRERKSGPLDFPKSGIGIQCDINFFNPLGLHNTQLLRCYSMCDPRVRPMVLIIKAWAKRRKINSAYSGTLSSYGYVLMALHYLVNVAQPPVLPNLQSGWRPYGSRPADASEAVTVEDWQVLFWRNEEEILSAAQKRMLTTNQESLGSLLAGFFSYYSSQGGGVSFYWMQEVLSLRSASGLVSKADKGWVKAVTEEGEGRRIQHRYLFCIEDPFELNHNVARTVTHNGIVAIRDEFRRAKRILTAVERGFPPRDGELFAPLVEVEDVEKATEALKVGKTPHGAANVEGRKATVTEPGAQNASARQHASHRSPRGNNASGRGGRANRPHSASNSPALLGANKQLVFNDNESFPILGAPKSNRKKTAPPPNGTLGNFSEISGDKARLVLNEVKRKKEEQADAQAEYTATGAAEAVLGDSD